jgi:COP9 signalosome complex subunit 7
MTELLDAYVATAATTRGAGVVHVIKQVLQAPGIFVFGELLETPSIVELSTNPEYADLRKWFDVLCIFAHGTYQDYKERSATLPPLGPTELAKLKELTVVTTAATHRVLTYDQLLSSLDIPDVRQLEDLLIDAITHGLINAKLDQRSRLVEVLDTMGRDLRPSDMDGMLRVLNQWVADSQRVLDTLTQVEESALAALAERATSKARLADRVEAMKQSVRKELAEGDPAGKGVLAPGQPYQDAMGDVGYGQGSDDYEDDYRRAPSAGRRKRGFGIERSTGVRPGGGL